MHNPARLLLPLSLFAALLATSPHAPAQSKLLRFPDCHGDQVVFTHGGDLWLAPLLGGTATRLTSHPGLELFAKFSPDGRHIAFTGQIDGDEQVYVIPATGGEPRQLTFYPARGPLPDRWGYDHQVYGWTPDGSAVLFRSLREAWTLTGCRLYTVAFTEAALRDRGALPVPLPMPISGAGDIAANGQIVYSPLFRDFRTWKRYEGGWAQDLWLFDPATGETRNITDHPRTDRDPMWVGDRVYFCSDRTGTLNLWSWDPNTGKSFQETRSDRWDVRWPGAGGPRDQRIVYEKGGELWWYDCATRSENAIPITVPDEGLARRPARVEAARHVEHWALGPGGRRAVFAARGEVLTVPLEHGDVRNLTRSPGVHEKGASFSPDGTQVAFVSDRGGEEQIWLVDHLGAEPARQLTKDLAVMLYPPRWSPDGRSLAFGDKDGVLRVVDVADGAMVQVADEERGQIHDHAWSPCSQHLAFSLTQPSDLRAVFVWSRADGRLHRVSRALSEDWGPTWDGKGERLFFLGRRGFAPRIGALEWNYQVDRSVGVFALSLRADLPALLPPRSDEAPAPAKADAAVEQKAERNGDAQPAPGAQAGAAAAPAQPAATMIDFTGIAERVEPLPLPLDNWTAIEAADGGLLCLRGGGFYYGRDSDRKPALQWFDFGKRETTELADDVQGFDLSPDRKKVLLRQGGKYLVADAGAGGKDGRKELKLGGLPVDRVPAEEWPQIFAEVWRRFRDFFYVANMHGHDWLALRRQYEPLVAHVGHRSDLNYVLGEMIAELNVGHAYIAGGEFEQPARPAVALPGAVFRFDRGAGRYRIARILSGQNDDAVYRAPLTEVGVQASAGDWLLAIDGEDVGPTTNPYRLLRHKGDRQVTLLLNAQPVRDGARAVTFRPIASEEKLHYLAWVEHNRARVAELSGGRLGYLHIPDMGADGIREFIKAFYPQRDKQGLVIDVRSNGGGNVSQMILERLSRRLHMVTFGRTSGTRLYPDATFHGHLVCLLNETSASDGDIFPAMFRRAGLGKLVGKRSWGGIIGITNRGMLMDGGTVNVPEFGNTEPGPVWTIEGVGVSPDIEVDNDLPALLAGRDPQLEQGVEVLLQQIADNPMPRPEPPPAPVKTGR